MENNFNDYRFEGLDYTSQSNKYFTMKRYNKEETKIIVNVGESHLIETKYGYALILDYSHVVFLKSWQVNVNYFGNEVLLQKDFFNVKEWGNHDEFSEIPENLNWETWVNVAKAQEASIDEEGLRNNYVLWKK